MTSPLAAGSPLVRDGEACRSQDPGRTGIRRAGLKLHQTVICALCVGSGEDGAELGFSLVIFPIGMLLAATAGIRALLAGLQADGVPPLTGLPTFGEFTDLIGLPEVQQLEQRFSGHPG